MWTGIGIAAGAIGGALLTSNASNKASGAQSASAAESVAEQRRQYDLTRADNAPFLKTGTAANRRLASLLGIGGQAINVRSDVESEIQRRMNDYGHSRDEAERDVFSGWGYTPERSQDNPDAPLLRKFGQSDLDADPVFNSGLKFGADQGRDAINARATAGGMYDSGATLKALTRFGNDYGSTKANESYNRYNATNDSIFNRLSGVSGTGQVATGQVSAAGANMANNVSNTLEGAGNARAAGIVGGANAWGGAITNANAGYNNYQNNQRLNALLARGGGGNWNPYQNYSGSGTGQPDYSAGYY